MSLTFDALYLNVFVSVGLVTMSGLFSGLTLGLMSLDIVGLQILAESGRPIDRERASCGLSLLTEEVRKQTMVSREGDSGTQAWESVALLLADWKYHYQWCTCDV